MASDHMLLFSLRLKKNKTLNNSDLSFWIATDNITIKILLSYKNVYPFAKACICSQILITPVVLNFPKLSVNVKIDLSEFVLTDIEVEIIVLIVTCIPTEAYGPDLVNTRLLKWAAANMIKLYQSCRSLPSQLLSMSEIIQIFTTEYRKNPKLNLTLSGCFQFRI
jgi:hypothetical protein